VDLKFPREGINYDELSDEEKEEWESIDWGDDVEPDAVPDHVSGQSINSWFFNADTVDKAIAFLWENGHRVDGGDRLAKTIIFARNHKHAKFIEERFNKHYPQYMGHFAQVIDNQVAHSESLIDEFSNATKDPQIAISVDMLDTGIDVPEVANLVFFKPVYSKIKFWQMIGRGTRLCPDLYGPGQDKQDFRIFDFCGNFAYFSENPDGIEASASPTLATRLFRSRVKLVRNLQAVAEVDSDKTLEKATADTLHGEVAGMNHDNFIVRRHIDAVEIFEDRARWDRLSDNDETLLFDRVSQLPSEIDIDGPDARTFDHTALRMQLALLEGDTGLFERNRRRVVDMAEMLQEKVAIPAVKEQLEFLQSLQDEGFWDGMNVNILEDMRQRMRGLVQFIDRRSRAIVYTDFEDEIVAVTEETVIELPKMTGLEYEKKVREYLAQHEDHLVIQRLRSNKSLTALDLDGLQQTLVEIGDEDGQSLLNDLLERNDSASLAHFIRSMVGMDREAANAAFSQFLDDASLNSNQIRFVEMIIEQLTERGLMTADALYAAPFTSLHGSGPEGLFPGKDNVVNGIFEALEETLPKIDSKTG